MNMLKPFVSMFHTLLLMLTLTLTLRGAVQIVALLDTSAIGVSMSCYRKGDGRLYPNPRNHINQHPNRTDTTSRAD